MMFKRRGQNEMEGLQNGLCEKWHILDLHNFLF